MAEKEWFTDWFDSEYYHLLYSNRNEEEAENFISSLVKRLQIEPGAKILDVACGKGRHAKTLSKLGFDVYGIDLSANSIDFAKQFTHARLHFEQWDMRKTYKSAHFDFVLNLFSSFGYLPTDEDNLIALKAIASNMKPSGRLVLDYMNAEFVIKNMIPREIVTRNTTQFHISKKIESGFIIKSIRFIDKNGSIQEYEERLRIIKPETFESLFEEAGLLIESKFGDYNLNQFSHKDSPRQLLIARLK